MLKDMASMNPKGRVKVELYNENGVFETIENKNMVVLDANKIVAEMMADPAKTTRISVKDAGESSLVANADGKYEFTLSVNRVKSAVFSKDLNSAADVILDPKNIVSIKKVTIGTTDLVINTDVFLSDAEEGKLSFATSQTGALEVEFTHVANKYLEIIEGTEVVKVGVDTWTRSDAPSDVDKKYVVDYATGKLLFETAKTQLRVEYAAKMFFGLGFMGLGGIPAGHTPFKPVEFSNLDKLDKDMENEFADARRPIYYPADITAGVPEIEVLNTKPLVVEKKSASITITDSAVPGAADLIYELTNKGIKLVKITKADKAGTDILADVSINDAIAHKIAFASGSVATGDVVNVEYEVQKDKSHLKFQLAQAPVIELLSVKYVDSATLTPQNITVQDSGLKIGVGQVWLTNPNAGQIEFSEAITSTLEVDGQLTIEYKVNSGTVVKFIADFPKGVPAPIPTTDTFKKTTTGETTFLLPKAIRKDDTGNFVAPIVTLNAVSTTQFTISADGTQVAVTDPALTSGTQVQINYEYDKDTHEIYQVAMFTEQKASATNLMFNKAGLGPVTKDKNTGLRVTWSVTF